MYSKFTSPPIVSAALRPRQRISSGQQMAAMQRLGSGQLQTGHLYHTSPQGYCLHKIEAVNVLGENGEGFMSLQLKDMDTWWLLRRGKQFSLRVWLLIG